MGQEFGLLRDIALIMVAAGVVTLLFHKLRQPPVLGYLLAGLLLGPHLLPDIAVTDIDTIGLLADIGLVLLLFGVGLEFSWSKIRLVGLSVLLIGSIEILTMISVGYGIGRLLGWSQSDAFFLGAALHISSSAIIVKVLRDSGRLGLASSRIVVGILVVEDLAAVVIIAVLSGIATTGTANIGDIGSLLLRLAIFLVATLVFGTIFVPRIITFADKFRSSEVFLITGLALCFCLALLSKYLGLSVAVGAFLMGALIGDTKQSEQVTRVMTPIRDMFGALFFVTIGMLIDVKQFSYFIVPTIIISLVFIAVKIISNTVAAFMSGYSARTSLQVGLGMPQMGEFSLAIAKVGTDSSMVVAPLYPVVAVSTALTSFAFPYISRSTNTIAEFLRKKSPGIFKVYLTNFADWITTVRSALSRKTEATESIRRSTLGILINLLILLAIYGIGTFSFQFLKSTSLKLSLRFDLIALLTGFVVLVLSLPSLVLIWRNVRSLVDEASKRILSRHTARGIWRTETLAAVIRDTIVIILTVLVTIWLIPFMSQLLFVGSIAIALPALLLAVILYLVLRSVRNIHNRMEESVSRVILGERHTEDSEQHDGTKTDSEDGLD